MPTSCLAARRDEVDRDTATGLVVAAPVGVVVAELETSIPGVAVAEELEEAVEVAFWVKWNSLQAVPSFSARETTWARGQERRHDSA